MRLENKSIVLYGVGTPADAALVRLLALGRALVFVADRAAVDAEAFARAVIDAGGVTEASEVDLLDRQEVEMYTAETAAWTGGLDVAVVEMRDEDEDARLMVAMTAAQAMAVQGSGTVVLLSADTVAPSKFRRFAEDAAAKGVAVLTALPS